MTQKQNKEKKKQSIQQYNACSRRDKCYYHAFRS